MVSEKESQLFAEYAQSQGYEGFNGSKFKVKGQITSSPETVLKNINFPQGVDPTKNPELGVLGFKSMTNVVVKNALYDVLRSMALQTSSVSANPNADVSVNRGIIDPNKESVMEAAKRVLFFIHVDGKEKREEDNILAIDVDNRTIVTDIRTDVLVRARGLTRKQILEASEAFAVLEFDPYKTDFVIEAKRDYQTFKAFNLYNPPAWRRLKDPPAPAFRGFIKKVFEHVFIKQEEREYVLDWFHHALVRRNQTVLCLAGKKGTGKNLIMEKILGSIIGADYTESVGQAFLDEKFNAPLHNKRLVIMDEVTTNTQTAIDAIKRFANDRIAIEKKGQDAFTAKNYASMAILSNNITKLGIESNDRRYSIPEVAGRTMEEVHGPAAGDEILNFILALERNEEWVIREIAEFGYFLLNRKPTYPASVPLKGDYFYYIAEFSLPEWVSLLFDYLHDQGQDGVPVLFKEALKLKAEDKRNGKLYIPTKFSEFTKYLGDFRFRGKYHIGEIYRMEGPNGKGRSYPALIPNGQFLEAIRQDRLYKQARDERKFPTPLPVVESPDVVSQNDEDYDELESAEGLL